MRKLIYILLPSLIFLTGCMKDDQLWDFERPVYDIPFNGIFVTNEGNFMYGNASLTYYDPETREVYDDVFFNTNAIPLGDVAHSMTIRDSLGYVVVNNSGRIYIFNTRTFEMKGKITGLTSPRYIHFISETKAYVTDLYARSIAVVNPATMEVTGAIPVSNSNSNFYQHSTEQMLQYDRFVYTNCWSYDNQVLVIDAETDRVVDSIEVLKQPNSMVLDRHQTLWVLCDGGVEGSPYGTEPPGLLKIGAGSTEAEIVHRFSSGEMPTELKINGGGDTLYFINGDVYRYAVNGATDPEVLIESPYEGTMVTGFYGLDVDPVSSEVYVADAIDFVQRGMVYRFTSEGVPVDTFRTGIAPGGFCFKPAVP
ncbi:MAG: YncE family protein [Bacteroidales bacterium]|nr:YncE family protein [Bacteroidales bacterium]